ncbi:hypothetical protein BH09BAC5_BH09BAC5_01460 [soil metagenome]
MTFGEISLNSAGFHYQIDTTVYRNIKQNKVFPNIRFGDEIVRFKRLALNFDFGLGYMTHETE